ncbi:hypothetical protein CHL67_02225 [Prosthecochloris sp. GSB1]|uniref:outer membrane protein n=1 Tax=Prosthecochloris sp. GSB1 TaxID=281093 RepID=UPI000B8C8AD3|nr:outer membrane beta-barrel protein [Prosthecochloris sp. GSB1]ASQ89890.1 hypothetical protein CHL67_02225 [Prosthecochloris sp. GSB1]
MKKALSLLAVFLVAATWSSTGFSAEKYVSGNIGISWFNDIDLDPLYEFDGEDITQKTEMGSGIALTGAFGCDYGDFRTELELGYQTSDVENMVFIEDGDEYDFDDNGEDISGDVSVTTLMANGYYDIDLGGIELFLTAGVGIAQIDVDDVDYDEENIVYNSSETTLAYQLGAGFGIPVSDGIMLDARYRYFATTDATISGGLLFDEDGNGNIESHSALIGLRVAL